MAEKKKAGNKKKSTKSKKQDSNSASSKNVEFEKVWKKYNSSLNEWKASLAHLQKATKETLMTYHDACHIALETDAELLKKVSTSWEETWEDIGPQYVKQQTEMIENIFKQTNIETIKKFNKQWERFLTTSGNDSIKAYQEAIKKFNQAWQSSSM